LKTSSSPVRLRTSRPEKLSPVRDRLKSGGGREEGMGREREFRAFNFRNEFVERNSERGVFSENGEFSVHVFVHG